MMKIRAIYDKLYIELNSWIREHLINPKNRKKLKKHEVCILTNNCLGGCISHDLGLRFNSPLVNLWLSPKDFIKFCSNIEHYKTCQLSFLSSLPNINYPVAKLDDITIYFEHYHSEQTARKKWYERFLRLNQKSIYCILIERDGCTEEDLVNFSKLPFPKASLVHKPMPHIPNSHYIRGFEDAREVGNIMVYRSLCGYKYYDDFDYVSFLNG